MGFEKQNKLSEGVGKRIIEALKTNSESELQEEMTFKNQNPNNYMENPSCRSYQEPEYKDYTYNYEFASPQNYSVRQEEYVSPVEYREPAPKSKQCSFDSSNIDTLVDLVTKLPPGVTKQTGAQIIRHTMEAMGIPINQVLAKAQMFQEDLEHSIKSNINVIEEHREKIKILEQEIQQFRKKAHDLEDIISLFILSEKK